MASIDEIQRACAVRSDVLGLAGGLPDPAFFPRAAMSDASAELLHEPSLAALQYGWPEGDASLRQFVAKRAGVPFEDVIVTAGAQQAIMLATDALLARGDAVAVQCPTYPAALELFRSRALHITDDFESARAVYVMPEIDNPRGLPIDDALACTIARATHPIFVDDAYADLRFDGRRTNFFTSAERVWHIGTFAKTLCPGLRVGWLVPPREHRARVLALKHDADLQTNTFGQAVLAKMFERFDYDAHLEKLRRAYRLRAEALVCALARKLPSWSCRMPLGGFSVWVDTNARVDDVAFLEAASAVGVSFDPGRSFSQKPDETTRMRLCHSRISPQKIHDAVTRLAHAWDHFAGAPVTRESERREHEQNFAALYAR